MPATISKVADRGTHAALDAATTSTLTITNPTLISVGNYLIMRVAGDNSGGSGAARTLTIPNSGSGDPRNAWTIHSPANCDPGAASAGVTVWVCYAEVNTAYQAGDTIILNWSGNIGANAECLEEWTGINKTTAVAVTPTNQVTGATPGTTLATAITGTPTATGQLFYVAFGWEGIAADTFVQDADSTAGTWVTPTSVATADATRLLNVRITGGYKIVTGTNAQSYNPTGITSGDLAGCAYIFDVDPGNATASAVATTATATDPAATATGDGVASAVVMAAAATVSLSTGAGTGGADPGNLGVTLVGTTATLTWDASGSPGVTSYSCYHRTPSTGAPFVPGVDTPFITGVVALTTDDAGLAEATYDWQVFGVSG